MRTRLVAWIFVCAAVACRSEGIDIKAKEMGSSEAQRVVEDMVAAYNRHDANTAAAAYAPGVQFNDFPDQPFLQGREAVRTRFQRAFTDGPNVRVDVSPRIVHGRFVVDRENISGLPGGKTVVALWIYEVRDGQIVRAWRVPEGD